MLLKIYPFLQAMCLLIPVVVSAQTPGGFGTHVIPSGECISSEERNQIRQHLQVQLQTLGLPQQQSTNGRTGVQPHPLFITPLRKVAKAPYFDVYGTVNFLDHNATTGTGSFNQYTTTNQDYNCGNRTYDNNRGYNHSGTDYMLWPYGWLQMDSNYVEVVAAAEGTIISKWDGNPDRNCGVNSLGTGIWNAVYLRHNDGSVTWYGHLKKGSLTPKAVGSQVAAGEYLGLVGSSGSSTDPHLHFEVYDASNKLIDPYAGSCNAKNPDSWWLDQKPYHDPAINSITTHATPPVFSQCPPERNQVNARELLPAGSPIYFYTFGRDVVRNDVIAFSVIRPDGSMFRVNSFTHSQPDYALFYYWTSMTIPASEPAGVWKVRVSFKGKSYDKEFTLCHLPVMAGGVRGHAETCLGTQTYTLDTAPETTYTWALSSGGTLTSSGDSASVEWSTPGVHTLTVTPANACGTGTPQALTVRVSAKPDKPFISYNNEVLNSSAPAGNQWYLNGSIITDATDQVYAPSASGSYTVRVSNSCGMSPFSDPYEVSITGIDPEIDRAVTLFPNPADRYVHIALPDHLPWQSIELYEAHGRQVKVLHNPRRHTSADIHVSTLPAGLYLVRIETSSGAIQRKLVVSGRAD